MNRKISLIAAIGITLSFAYCTSSNQQQSGGFVAGNDTNKKASPAAPAPSKETESKGAGIGKFKDVQLTHPLDAAMVIQGEEQYNSKCVSCHKLTDEKLVGPGWKGVTDRRKPEWILNFITNTDVMLDSDLVAQQLMVICVARMPNQNLSDEQARAVLEFMRKNDGKN